MLGMLVEHRVMQSRIWVLAVVVWASCTRPNPRDCSDGLCSDPAYPFCDVDGSLEGQVNTCIAVSCTPGDLRACRGDAAVLCNATGNNYELIECELGCDATHGCRTCTSAADCGNPTPICDSDANTCRACELDAECPSEVCDQGTCLDESGILYVRPNGSNYSNCSHAEPCSLLQAHTLAFGAAVPPIIRLLPAVYPAGIDITTPTTLPLRYVASGATIAAQYAIRVADGAKVDVRGLTASGTTATIHCTSMTNTSSSVTLRDSVITAGDGGATLVHLEKCTFAMVGGELDIGSSTGSSVLMMMSDVVFSADRVHVHGMVESRIGAAFATRINVKITNSVLDNVHFQWATSDSSSPGSLIVMGFNTILGQLNCAVNSGSAYRTARYQNNIVVSTDSAPAVDGTDCTLSDNILFPFNGTLGTNIATDPQFEDSGAKDYRLRSTSPAIDSAVPTTELPATTDFAGVSRPQGAQSDLGAFERVP